MDNVCLLIGNGFTIDFIRNERRNKKINLDSSKPLSNFGSERISYESFIDKLPLIRDHLIPLSKRLGDDFEAIRMFLEIEDSPDEFEERDYQLRRFLALSYSLLQLELENNIWENWPWLKWLKKYKKNLSCAISFNYDTLLEKYLKLVEYQNPYRRIGVLNEGLINSLPIIKPHGSIEFDLAENVIQMDEESAWNSRFSNNQTFINGEAVVTALPQDKWISPRLQPDIIPPTQENYNRLKIDWVKYCFDFYEQHNQRFPINHFVIVGHSYSECDRKEINLFIDSLTPGCKFYIVNRTYDEKIKELIDYIKERKHIVVTEPGTEPPKIYLESLKNKLTSV
ncbi:hypothetical protein ACTFQN_06200 [Bacillus cereus group sp. MYBK30-1]|uniref:hypothetical protein n=1 Tax=unclassified Bacillus cereus group TaxID=2750818 RepID=UPI003F792D68